MARPSKYEQWQRENPDGTPYDALMSGMIDQKKYDELTVKPEPLPNRIQPVITQQAMPHAKPITRAIKQVTNDDRVYVKYMPTGALIPMNRKQAQNIVRNSPKNYQIQS